MINKKIASIVAVVVLLSGNVVLPLTTEEKTAICSQVINVFNNNANITLTEVQFLLKQANISYGELMDVLEEERDALLANSTVQAPTEPTRYITAAGLSLVSMISSPFVADQIVKLGDYIFIHYIANQGPYSPFKLPSQPLLSPLKQWYLMSHKDRTRPSIALARDTNGYDLDAAVSRSEQLRRYAYEATFNQPMGSVHYDEFNDLLKIMLTLTSTTTLVVGLIAAYKWYTYNVFKKQQNKKAVLDEIIYRLTVMSQGETVKNW
jgi:hypothetical protein